MPDNEGRLLNRLFREHLTERCLEFCCYPAAFKHIKGRQNIALQVSTLLLQPHKKFADCIR